jgi:peptidoglycan hydrolase CwlO-like protein
MTDNEIMTTWHFSKVTAANIGSVTLSKETIFAIDDLINRQNSNIEELKSENSNLTSDLSSLRTEIEGYKKHIDNDIIYVHAVRAEAVKEFAERLKTKVDGWYYDFAKFDDTMDALMEIANLVKEFTEGEKK